MPKNSKSNKNYKEFKFEGENGNVFEGRLYTEKKATENAESYGLGLTINGLAIVGAKLVDSKKGAFISFPTYKNSKGEYKSLIYFFNKEDIADCKAFVDYLMSL